VFLRSLCRGGPIQRPPFLPSPTFAGSSDPAIRILFAGKEALSELDGLLLLFWGIFSVAVSGQNQIFVKVDGLICFRPSGLLRVCFAARWNISTG
jgi:hypothetical protein